MDAYLKKMDGAVDSFAKELAGLRTGRVASGLLEPIIVDAYGSNSPLNQVASITVSDPQTLGVQVWDKNLVKAVDKAIRDAGLGLNPIIDGAIVRVPVPPLTKERRQELSKIAGKYAEDAKISIRNVRRDLMESIKKREKSKEISEDELHREEKSAQEQTDKRISKIDELLAKKQKEILTV